jgi:hypothetical protein
VEFLKRFFRRNEAANGADPNCRTDHAADFGKLHSYVEATGRPAALAAGGSVLIWAIIRQLTNHREAPIFWFRVTELDLGHEKDQETHPPNDHRAMGSGVSER